MLTTNFTRSDLQMLEMLVSSFQWYWTPGNELVIDEDVCSFKGRSILKQYLPAKPHKWGFRVWKMCDSSGYLFNLDVYQGKEEARHSYDDPTIGEKVVQYLLQRIEQKRPPPIHLFMDNFFTSLRMLADLKSKNIFVTGTIRKTRVGMPREKIDAQKKIPTGSSSSWIMDKTDILLTTWMDTKLVIVVTTAFGTIQSSLLRWNGSEQEQRQCPHSVKSYIENMGFVDHHNQQLELINMHRKCYKWWHSLFFYFISLVVANAWTIHRKSTTSKPLSFRKFMRAIYENLLQVCLEPSDGHDLPVHIPFSTENRGHCSQCPSRGRTSIQCSHCHVYLHHKCFAQYHTSKKWMYWDKWHIPNLSVTRPFRENRVILQPSRFERVNRDLLQFNSDFGAWICGPHHIRLSDR